MTVVAATRTSALSRLGVDFDAAYNEHVPLMIGIAVDRFHISETDAQTLAHQVFLTYFLKHDDVRDLRAWFVGSICNASKHYLRTRAREVALPADILDEPDPHLERTADALPDQLAAREALSCLTPRCQLALRLRYLDGYSIAEIAAQLHTTPQYAQKLVSRCLRQASDRYAAKGDM